MNASNVKGVQPNKSFVRALDGLEKCSYSVRVPPRPVDGSSPLTLLRYTSAVDYAPIPLRVVPRWAFENGVDRLELRVMVHPNLKAGLSDVHITVAMPEGVSACDAKPAGSWDSRSRVLVWRLPHMPRSSTPTCAIPHVPDHALLAPYLRSYDVVLHVR